MKKQSKNTVCLWYDGDAEEAAMFLCNSVYGMERVGTGGGRKFAKQFGRYVR